ncbi:MAG: zinc ribbon domain-containing protein [Dehalococcoidaceae bacterium]|nr:zinc ribbon domain-containing protein [Dehalococcoidaceae bacterium]
MLNNRQLHALLHLAGIGKPLAGSPLWLLPEPQKLMPDDPAFGYLIDRCLIEKAAGGYRVNKMFAAALLTCAKPEEVLSIGIDDKHHPGFALARRTNLWCECSINGDGTTKIFFPLSRSTLVMVLTDALTGSSSDEGYIGFTFRGSAAEAFVLGAVMRELREYPRRLKLAEVKRAVSSAALNPAYAAPFTSVTGPQEIELLARDPAAIDRALETLIDAGHLARDNGGIHPTEITAEVLGKNPEAGFALSRTLISENGPKTSRMLAIKAGPHRLVFRIANPMGSQLVYEWLEVDRMRLRLLVAAMIMPESVASELNMELSLEEAQPFVPHPTPTAPGPSFCSRCGAGLKDNARFCSRCGAKITKSAGTA